MVCSSLKDPLVFEEKRGTLCVFPWRTFYLWSSVSHSSTKDQEVEGWHKKTQIKGKNRQGEKPTRKDRKRKRSLRNRETENPTASLSSFWMKRLSVDFSFVFLSWWVFPFIFEDEPNIGEKIGKDKKTNRFCPLWLVLSFRHLLSSQCWPVFNKHLPVFFQ